MATSKQAAANRRNALQSTGPRTPKGKARSSLNAVQHGLLAIAPVLTHVETTEAWEAHRDAVVASLEPVNHLEALLVERVALQAWRLGRVARHEVEKLSPIQDSVRLVPGKYDMALILRYESHLERSMYRSLHELQRLQAARTGGKVATPVAVDVSVAGGG
jgi:hypothetical protein